MQVKPLVCTGELSGIVVEPSRLISTDTEDGQAKEEENTRSDGWSGEDIPSSLVYPSYVNDFNTAYCL